MPKFQPSFIKPERAPDIAYIESHRADIPVIEMLMVSPPSLPARRFARQRDWLRR